MQGLHGISEVMSPKSGEAGGDVLLVDVAAAPGDMVSFAEFCRGWTP